MVGVRASARAGKWLCECACECTCRKARGLARAVGGACECSCCASARACAAGKRAGMCTRVQSNDRSWFPMVSRDTMRRVVVWASGRGWAEDVMARATRTPRHVAMRRLRSEWGPPRITEDRFRKSKNRAVRNVSEMMRQNLSQNRSRSTIRFWFFFNFQPQNRLISIWKNHGLNHKFSQIHWRLIVRHI